HFRDVYFKRQGAASQEDDGLFLIAKMNYDENDLDRLISFGLEFDAVREYSNDFVIHQRYHGYLWKVDWIEDNRVFAWHTQADEQLKNTARAFGDVTGDAVNILFGKGVNPFVPLTLSNLTTHPMIGI